MNEIDIHKLEDSPLGVGIRLRAVISQPIHTTLKPQAKPERFELTWSMIESICSSGAEVSNGIVAVSGVHLTNGQTVQEAATALEIILNCRTFSPGTFERVNGVWQREGSKSKHENSTGY